MKPQRILVVEDEPDLRTLLEYNLRHAGFEVESASGGLEALRSMIARRPDLVVLDLMLPDVPGTHVCREIRAGESTRSVPVLMLTAKGEESSRVHGLEIGADDYVVKPVSMRELVLRVRAILRRQGQRASAPAERSAASEDTSEILSAGPIRVDLAAHQAWIDDRPLALTPIELKLLRTLLEHKGRAQARERLLEQVWEQDEGSTSRTVDTHVKRLRAKLGAAGELIETVRGLGYRLRR